MIVHPPEIQRRDGEVIISSRFSSENPTNAISETIWYALPEKYEPHLSRTAEPFATALLPAAMALGEDMTVRGPLSSHLLYGMQEYQKIFAIYWPDELTIVDISPDEITTHQGESSQGKVASTFSGGLDSGYTVWAHLRRNQSNPYYRLDYAVLVQGFDLPLDDPTGFQQCVELYGNLLAPEGIELIPLRTNVNQVVKSIIRWHVSQGAGLNSIGLLLSPLLKTYFIPASGYFVIRARIGTHPLFDHLLSTENLEVIHHGADINRFDKFMALADWDDFLSIIRVCYRDPKGALNCGYCVKCNRAMAALELLGKLDNWKTMPDPKGRKQIRMARAPSPTKAHDVRLMIDFAEKIGRKDMAFDLRYALFRTWTDRTFRRLLGERLFQFAKKLKNLPKQWLHPTS